MADCGRAWVLIGADSLTTEFCCESCHQDAEIDTAYLVEVVLPDGTDAQVCCAVQDAMAGT